MPASKIELDGEIQIKTDRWSMNRHLACLTGDTTHEVSVRPVFSEVDFSHTAK